MLVLGNHYPGPTDNYQIFPRRALTLHAMSLMVSILMPTLTSSLHTPLPSPLHRWN